MTYSVKHKFINLHPDDADTTITRNSDWNDEHDHTMASQKVLGRLTAGTGDVEELDFQQVTSGLTIESFGASPTATDAVNTAAIQAALDVGGLLWLTTPGTYGITAELQIGSYTDLRFAPGVILQRKANDINMMRTAAYLVTPTTITLSWSSGVTVTVTWTNHGLSVGDPVCIQGANPSQFNGVFLVKSVTNANVFLVDLMRLPLTSPTGTIKARLANRDIRIDGGTWDFNSPTYTRTSLDSSCFFFAYAYDSHVSNMDSKNTSPYTMNCGALRDCTIDGVQTNSAAGATIQVYGPSFNVHVSNVGGQNGDDGVAFMTKEFAIFSTYIWTAGDVIGCSARNINTEVIGAGHVAAAYWTADEYLTEVHFENIHGGGSGANTGLVFLDADDNTTDTAGFISIDKVSGYSPTVPIVFGKGTLARLTISNVVLEGQTVPYDSVTNRVALFSMSGSSSVDRLEIDGYSIKDGATGWNGADSIYLLSTGDGAVINQLILRNINIPTSSNIRIVQIGAGGGGALLNLVLYDNCNINTTDSLINIGTGVLGSPQITVQNSLITAAYGTFSGVSATVSFFNCKLEGMASGLVTADTDSTTQTVYGTGNSSVGGISVFCGVFANSPKFDIRTTNFFDTALNIDTRYKQTGGNIEYDGAVFYKTPTTKAGRALDVVENMSMCYNTNSAAATTAAQAWFVGNGATGIALTDAATYLFEGQLFLANGTVSHTTSLLFGLSGGLTLVDITYTAEFLPILRGGTAATPQFSSCEQNTAFIVGSASTATGAVVSVKGMVRASASGVFTPQFQWSASPTGTNQVLYNTWFSVRPLGAQTVTSVGNWT